MSYFFPFPPPLLSSALPYSFSLPLFPSVCAFPSKTNLKTWKSPELEIHIRHLNFTWSIIHGHIIIWFRTEKSSDRIYSLWWWLFKCLILVMEFLIMIFTCLTPFVQWMQFKLLLHLREKKNRQQTKTHINIQTYIKNIHSLGDLHYGQQISLRC